MFNQSRTITAKDVQRRDIIVIENEKKLGLIQGYRDVGENKILTYLPISILRKNFAITSTDRTIAVTGDQKKVLGLSFEHEYCVTLDLEDYTAHLEQRFSTAKHSTHNKVFINQCLDRLADVQERDAQAPVQEKSVRNRTPATKKARQSSGKPNILDIAMEDAITVGVIDQIVASQVDVPTLKQAYEQAKDLSTPMETAMRERLKDAWNQFTKRALKLSAPPIPESINIDYPPAP